MNGSLLAPNPGQWNEIEKQKEINRKTAIYKDVLSYPSGAEHLKYFDKNPHPGRIPDEQLAIWEISARKSLNTSPTLKKMDFAWVKNLLRGKLSIKDKKLLSLPENMEKMIAATDDKDYITAYSHLRDCFYTYFSAPLNESIPPDIQWIDYAFSTSCQPAQKALAELNNNLFNAAAIDTLAKKLADAGAFADERKDFYFWNTTPNNWSDISYQSRKATVSLLSSTRAFKNYKLSPQYIALGNFTINAIPEGYVRPKANGKYDICVNKVYFFINDMFNFEGLAFLGYWDLWDVPESGIFPAEVPLTPLHNSDFREYQRHGYGRYFPVLSRLHEAENFQPICKEYPFHE